MINFKMSAKSILCTKKIIVGILAHVIVGILGI